MNMLPNQAESRRRLLSTAAAMLTKCPSVPSAAAAMEQILVADRMMLRALITDFLTGVREAELRGGGHPNLDAHRNGAPAAQPHGDGEGHTATETRLPIAPSSLTIDEVRDALGFKPLQPLPSASSPPEEPPAVAFVMPKARVPGGSSPSDAAVGQELHDARSAGAPAASPPHDRAGQGGVDAHRRSARPVVTPNPTKRTVASVASVQPTMRRTVLDTFKVRDGRAVGDLLWRELTVFARENEVEGRVLRAIAAHATNVNPEAKVRSVVKAGVVEAAIRSAKEPAHV